MSYNQLSLYSNDSLVGYKKKSLIHSLLEDFVTITLSSDQMLLCRCLKLM